MQQQQIMLAPAQVSALCMAPQAQALEALVINWQHGVSLSQNWASPQQPPSGPVVQIASVGAAGFGDDLQVLLARTDGELYHSCDWSQPASTGAQDVAAVAGANAGGNLHCLVVRTDGELYHNIRYTTGAWQGSADTGARNIAAVAAAGIGGDLHVIVVQTDGALYHNIRFSDGTWQGFANVEQYAPNPPGNLVATATSIACAAVGADLHVLGIGTGRDLYHTVRHADGSWQAFAQVSAPSNLTAVASTTM